MRRTTAGTALVAVVVLTSGCGGPLDPFAGAQGCTDMGAPEGVSVDLTTVLPFEGGDYHATVSVPELGASSTTGFAGNDSYGLSGGVQADLTAEPVTVDVEVVTETGAVAYRTSARVTPVLHQPNGAACDGANYRIDVQATDDGQLVPLPLGEPARDDRGRVSLVVFTSCGVSSISDGYRAYVRVGGTLDDGAGGPPPGWNTPDHRGWAAIEGDVLTFEDELGHREVFQRTASDDVPAACT